MTLFIAVLISYLLLVLAVAAHGLLRTRTGADFWVAGRRASGLSTGGSLTATIIGGSSTLGLAGLAFRQGLTGSWWLLVGAAGLSVLWFLVPSLKRKNLYTLPQLIGTWYGPGMRRISSLLILAAWLGIVGAQANAAGRLLSSFLGGSSALWAAAAGALFIAYTAAGGQISVIRTDLLQALLIVGGISACTLVALGRSGGLDGLRLALPPSFFSFPVSPAFSVFDLLLLVLVVGSTYLLGPDMLSRVFCSRGAGEARRGVLLSIAAIIPVALLVTLCGMCARRLFPSAAAEAALPLLAKEALPPWPAALLMIALLSAFLSSADTTLLTMSAIVCLDLLGAQRGEGLLRGRLAVLACGAAALLVGILSGGIIPSLLIGYSVFSGGLFAPVIAGLTGRPLPNRTAIIVACLGGLTAALGKILNLNSLVAASFAPGILVLLADRLRATLSRATRMR